MEVQLVLCRWRVHAILIGIVICTLDRDIKVQVLVSLSAFNTLSNSLRCTGVNCLSRCINEVHMCDSPFTYRGNGAVVAIDVIVAIKYLWQRVTHKTFLKNSKDKYVNQNLLQGHWMFLFYFGTCIAYPYFSQGYGLWVTFSLQVFCWALAAIHIIVAIATVAMSTYITEWQPHIGE